MARKLKIKIKTDKFSIPIPALPLSMIDKLLKVSFRIANKHGKLKDANIKFDPDDISRLIKTLKETEPFELVNVVVDDPEEKVYVHIYTK